MILGICCIVNNALLIKVQTKNLFTSQSIELIEIVVSISVLVVIENATNESLLEAQLIEVTEH